MFLHYLTANSDAPVRHFANNLISLYLLTDTNPLFINPHTSYVHIEIDFLNSV